MKKIFLFFFIGSMVFSLVLVEVAWADSTIGTNMSTTGTLTVNSGSATAVRFQNGSGTNLFVFDATSNRLGVGAGALDTKFEVGGTASATNLMVSGAVQFAGNASVAYSRFGTTATNHANYISASSDLLVSGDVEIRGTASFGGTASVSGVFSMNDGRFRPNSNSATAFRFQNTAGTTSVLTIDTTNTRVGVNAGGAVDTTFEVGGAASISGDVSTSARFELTSSAARFGLNAGGFTDTAFEVGGTGSISGNVFFGSKASISGNLQISSRFIADTAASHSFTGDLVVKGSTSGIASLSHGLNVGENSTATTSVTFETKSSTQGICFVITNTEGTTWYARLVASGSGGTQARWFINSKDCR